MDVVVTPASTKRGTWILEDLLGRKLGEIYQAPAEGLYLAPVSEYALHGISPGPYGSLAAALSAIEKHTRGQCRLSNRPPS